MDNQQELKKNTALPQIQHLRPHQEENGVIKWAGQNIWGEDARSIDHLPRTDWFDFGSVIIQMAKDQIQ